jgi:hypothetical protein
MGLQIRDDRQMKALTGLSQAQFDHLLLAFNDLYQGRQQKTYEAGVASGMRRRKPGGGSKGKLPTIADKLLFLLYYYKTYPTLMSWGHSARWHGRKPMKISINSRRFCTTPWSSST